jgi:hypothetical protein
MTENMPILYQNIMFGLPDEISRQAFLWAVERPGEDRMCYRAESFAREVSKLVAAFGPMLDVAFRCHNHPRDNDLMDFILKRHANFRFGGNVSPNYGSRP